MLKDKLVALAKTLPQRPRSRLVPLPDYAEALHRPSIAFGDGSLLDALDGRRAGEDAASTSGAPTSSTSSWRRTC